MNLLVLKQKTLTGKLLTSENFLFIPRLLEPVCAMNSEVPSGGAVLSIQVQCLTKVLSELNSLNVGRVFVEQKDKKSHYCLCFDPDWYVLEIIQATDS